MEKSRTPHILKVGIVCLLLLVTTKVIGQTQPTGPVYFVGLKSGKVLTAQSISLRERGFNSSYLILDGQEQILLDQVLYFQNQDGYFVYEPIEGARRSTLLRREFEGNISMYTVTRMVYSSNNISPYDNFGRRGRGSYREKTEFYFRKGNGPIQRYNYRNLKVALSDNPESMAILQSIGRVRFTMYVMYGAGAGLTLWGLLSFTRDGRLPVVTYIGMALLLVPNFFGRNVDEKLEQALLIYNRG